MSLIVPIHDAGEIELTQIPVMSSAPASLILNSAELLDPSPASLDLEGMFTRPAPSAFRVRGISFSFSLASLRVGIGLHDLSPASLDAGRVDFGDALAILEILGEIAALAPGVLETQRELAGDAAYATLINRFETSGIALAQLRVAGIFIGIAHSGYTLRALVGERAAASLDLSHTTHTPALASMDIGAGVDVTSEAPAALDTQSGEGAIIVITIIDEILMSAHGDCDE